MYFWWGVWYGNLLEKIRDIRYYVDFFFRLKGVIYNLLLIVELEVRLIYRNLLVRIVLVNKIIFDYL